MDQSESIAPVVDEDERQLYATSEDEGANGEDDIESKLQDREVTEMATSKQKTGTKRTKFVPVHGE